MEREGLGKVEEFLLRSAILLMTAYKGGDHECKPKFLDINGVCGPLSKQAGSKSQNTIGISTMRIKPSISITQASLRFLQQELFASLYRRVWHS